MRKPVAAVVLVCVGVVGCKKPEDKPSLADSAPAASVSASASAMTIPSAVPEDFSKVKSNSDPAFIGLSLMGKLEFEKTHRPGITPNADTIFAEFEKLGAKWSRKQQVAGWTIGARYCNLVDSEKNVSVVICEFDDEASAKTGAAKSAKTDKVLKGREVLQKKQLFVAVNDLTEGKEGAAEAKAMKDFVKKL